MGKAGAAEAEYRQAVTVLQRLADDYPSVARFHHDLAMNLSTMGSIQRRMGRMADAVASHRSAIASLERLRTLPMIQVYNLACYQSLLAGVAAGTRLGPSAAEVRAAADRAMDSLRLAVSAGYRDLAHMQSDTDLDASVTVRTSDC